MSNPINIPKPGKRSDVESRSCPTNFVFYNKNNTNNYNNLFYSMKNLGVFNSVKSSSPLSMSPIMCGGLVSSKFSLSNSNNSLGNISGISSLNNYENKIMDNSVNSNNSSILLSYMNQYMSDNSDPDENDSLKYSDHDISNDAFAMDEDIYDEDNPFTFETFSNVAISLMKQNEIN
jgi:hypothetical protein